MSNMHISSFHEDKAKFQNGLNLASFASMFARSMFFFLTFVVTLPCFLVSYCCQMCISLTVLNMNHVDIYVMHTKLGSTCNNIAS